MSKSLILRVLAVWAVVMSPSVFADDAGAPVMVQGAGWFKEPLDTLEGAVKEHNANRGKLDTDELYDSGTRATIFKVEYLCKVFKKAFDEKKDPTSDKIFKSLYDRAKYYEDQISRLKDGKISTADFNKNVKAAGWLKVPGGTIDDIRKQLKNVKWKKASEERPLIFNTLARYYEKLLEDYKKKPTGGYDFRDDEQIHEFKRDIRTYTYVHTAFPGLFVEDGAICNKSAFRDKGMVCHLPKCLTDQIRDTVGDIGDARYSGTGPATQILESIKKGKMLEKLIDAYQDCAK